MGNPLDPIEPVAIHAEATSEANFSRTTVAQLKAAKEQMTEVRRSMLDDMARKPFANPEEGLQLIMDLQRIQSNLNQLEESVSARTPQGFTGRDVETMRTMKQNGAPETKIADRFGTNQSKVNRLLNGVHSPNLES